MKKHPDLILDDVLQYGQFLKDKGSYLFMDSPGNDLESIAGQVASGCNLISFSTGNGSITNFPFVPIIKIMSTTGRFKILQDDMDFNAGVITDEYSLEQTGKNLFKMLLNIASG